MPAALARVAGRHPLCEFDDANGRRWRWRDTRKEGPALVLLPGAVGDCDVAFKLVDALGADVRTLAVTYPSGAGPQELADGLAELLDSLALRRVAVWGSSYGAWWAQAFALRHASRVLGAWLGNTFVDCSAVASLALFDAAWLRRSSPEDVLGAWLDAAMQRPAGELRELQLYFLREGLTASELRLRLLEVATAGELAAPPLTGDSVVCDCADDPVIDTQERERVRQRFPAARHVRLPSGGHYPHLTHADELVARLRSWFDGLTRSKELQ